MTVMLDEKNTQEILSSVAFLISCLGRIENRLRLVERRLRDVEMDQERGLRAMDFDQNVRRGHEVGHTGSNQQRLVSGAEGTIPAPAALKAIAVVVPVHNAPEAVEECLTSLFENGGYSRLVVVDDASDETTARLLDAFHRRRDFILIRNASNLGYTKSINAGVREIGDSEAVVILNSDTVVTIGWLDCIGRAFGANPKVGIVGPWSNAATYQSVPDVKDVSGRFAVNQLPRKVVPDDWALALRGSLPAYPRVPIVNGFCFAVRSEVLRQIGEFDESAFPIGYGEENDFCIRAGSAGFEVAVADDAFVFHGKSKSFGAARRRKLAAAGRAALDAKYGPTRLKSAIRALEKSPDLDAARRSAATRISRAEPASLYSAFGGSIAYVLPAKPGGGGVHSVIQEASFLAAHGIKTTVLVPAVELPAFSAFYGGGIRSIVVGYRNVHDLHQRLRSNSVIVATIYRSIPLVRDLIGTVPARFFYYVQDYEPFFHKEGSREYREALASYDVDHRCILFAKTKWLQQTIKERHGRDVRVVLPSLDHDIFSPTADWRRRNRICAMVRPPTPRRSPVETVRLATMLARRRGNPPLSVALFGCDADDVVLDPVRGHARVDCVGRLRREDVADLLRSSDIFVDLSTYQAFGRTSLEAMACGCVPIVPIRGGSSEFAVPGFNSFAVDVSSPGHLRSCTQKIDAIYSDLGRFRSRSIETAAKYSTRSAADSILKTFMQV